MRGCIATSNMAAPLRLTAARLFCEKQSKAQVLKPQKCVKWLFGVHNGTTRSFYSSITLYNHASKWHKWSKSYITASVALTVGVSVYIANLRRRVKAHAIEIPTHKPIRSLRGQSDPCGLNLTLYQFQSCPFCTKVRTYLDCRGISYDIIEVHSLSKRELKWSKCKKVPQIVVKEKGEDGFLLLDESSRIISILESYIVDKSAELEDLMIYYPEVEVQNEKGKTVKGYPSKYNLVHPDGQGLEIETMKREKRMMKWRKWTDDHFVHLLSPNVYRTPSESMQAFRVFDEVGEWDKVFTPFERKTIMYSGALVMWLVGKKLKRKYELNCDVRVSLYDACDQWMHAVKKTPGGFMGGDKPDLADMAVYGCMKAIEGCTAFDETLDNSQIRPWYNAMTRVINYNSGVVHREQAAVS